MAPPVTHYAMSRDEYAAAIGQGRYIDADRYTHTGRAIRPEMICRTGDGHAVGLHRWEGVNCPACLAKAPARPTITQTRRAVFAMASRSNGYGVRLPGYEARPGELLDMSDGSQWFHPYGGWEPVKITADNLPGLTIDLDGGGVGWIAALKALGYTVKIKPNGFYQWDHEATGSDSSALAGYPTEGDAWAGARLESHARRNR